MKLQNFFRRAGILSSAVLFFCFSGTADIRAAAQNGSMLSVVDEAQVKPLTDGSGKYLLKSDGLYCLDPDGSRDEAPAVHYFDHFEIDGTELNGYYYHDESGKFRAGSPHVAQLKQLTCKEDAVFDGCYMVGNLGRLTAAPQVRYIDQLTLNGVVYNGYYYFNEYGRMVTDPGTHELHMVSNGKTFEGNYYFGGTNGVLDPGITETPDGLLVDADGKLEEIVNVNDALERRIQNMIAGYEGIWSVYVKNLNTGETLSVNNQPLHSASLIKAFVMAKTYADMDTVLANEAKKMNSTPDNASVQAKVDDLLWNMITVSDNESCNELVRLQADSLDFLDGAKRTNEFLEKEGYQETSMQHTLHPSSSASIGLGGNNMTSAEDCGRLLEDIFYGNCVSKEASEKMLNLMLNQKNTWKIPEGLPEVQVANKTGETDMNQHDIAIVYGEKTTYILCVLSEECPSENTAINNIRDISRVVYNLLNLYEVVEAAQEP